MKKTVTGAALVIALAGGAASSLASAADEVTIQLKWVTQGQFTGYIVGRGRSSTSCDPGSVG